MKEEKGFADMLWEMFRSTGNVGYYEFYSRLKDGKKDGRDSDKERRL